MDLPKLPKQVTDKFTVENNTLKRDAKADPLDRISVEIGDSKQPDFKPQAKIARWQNEVNFSIRGEEDPQATVEIEGEVVKYKGKDNEIHLYEKPDASSEGGFEFEWILPKKPKSNVLRTTINSKGLNFYYQPELTQEEIDEGAHRPEHVVGSYAVYHATKGGSQRAGGQQYKTGKFCHIYRPKVTDADGNEVWGELDISGNQLTVTVPQSFLDKGVYPIICDPTFGYETIGGTSKNIGGDAGGSLGINSHSKATGRDVNIPEDGDVTSLNIYVSQIPSHTDMEVFGGFWSSGITTSDSAGEARNGSWASENINGESIGWKQADFSTPVSLSAGTHKIVMAGAMNGSTLTEMQTQYDEGGTGVHLIEISEGSLPDLNPPVEFSHLTNNTTSDNNSIWLSNQEDAADGVHLYSIYATYQVSSTRRIFNIS